MSDDLNERIGEAQAKLRARARPDGSQSAKGLGLGFRMASDFVAAVIVGAALGWGVDEIFGVSPWGLVVCLILGFVTGVRNVVAAAMAAQRSAGGPDAGQGPDTSSGPTKREDNGA